MKKVLIFSFALAVTMLIIVGAIRIAECREDAVGDVSTAIQTLQPAVVDERAHRLAEHYVAAGEEAEIDPLLLVAITMRESSFDPLVERLERRGSLGEGGLMQCHGVSVRLRPRHCSRDLRGAECQIITGARWLGWVRDHCGGSTDRWVGAYGMSACPTEESARSHRSIRIVRAYYDEIGGEQWTP